MNDSPDAFLATLAQEKRYGQERWLAEFDRGDWYIGELGGKPVCLTGVTREPDAPRDECYLEYVWVAADFRRRRVAFDMLTAVLDDLKKSGIRTVFLWVLDGNDAALWLYKQLNFDTKDRQQPLEADPRRSEIRLRQDFA